MIDERQVDSILEKALPEFSDDLREHRENWPSDPMLYPLLGTLFNFIAPQPGQTRLDVARRAYEVTEKMLVDGTESVRDCFAIEMIEPLAGDPDEIESFYPGLESLLGPAAQRELASMREWGRHYEGMASAMKRLNQRTGRDLFKFVGIGKGTARIVADSVLWGALSEAERDELFERLSSDWEGGLGGSLDLRLPGLAKAASGYFGVEPPFNAAV
jgi:hypothetical protein